ncbi:farnesyl-diphosphate synthase [Loktanella sp. 3ANDIMAR09]|uniref:polyprenyl synthetase family protein n=1 Tax=Loktanella sp. 3ANDIMAR09 TaxID=1225657 RepID=UPI0006FE3C94|nr:polyprenyl synthetase family protein [Loktanella sp. 3ANDIMAR09]KQI70002.1 farnesyl-diphosphate synthase [Loktanella sp. 3ANDIMAR09]
MFTNQLALDASAAIRLIETALAPGADVPLREAMLYAVQGGKGLRAFLVREGARLHGVGDLAGHAAAAIEAVHAYSLVHDDLPAMDDDDLRRGQPTVHRKWDEATAILTGDALQSLAFELVCEPGSGVSDAARANLALTLAQAAGARGMVLGQALDIAAETGPPLDLDAITTLQAGKTGALITWSACAGPRIAGDDISALRAYGDALGLAFQIADDVLDATGDAATVGKAVGKDADAGKATFVSLLGLDGARARAHDLVENACDALTDYGSSADTLKEAARFVIARDK